jgi:hypothetical protein
MLQSNIKELNPIEMKNVYRALVLLGTCLFLFNTSVLQAQTKAEWMKQQEAVKNKFKEYYKAGFEQFKKDRY